MRLMEQPVINGDEFFIAGVMNATVVSPQNYSLQWLGGENLEFVTPSPEQWWYTNNRDGAVAGYSTSNPDRVERLGLGNIYIQPPGQSNNSTAPFVQQAEYLVVIEISALTAVDVYRISDREVSFADWQVTFGSDGSYTVTDTSLPDLIFTNNFE